MRNIRGVLAHLSVVNSYFLIGILFFIPLTTAGSTVLSVVVLVCWLLIADFKNDWKQIVCNPVAMASLYIFALHIIGLLWTEDIGWGFHVLKKSVKFLFIPIFMLYAREEHIGYYIVAFLSAMMFSELISYGIWFEIISPFKIATVDNPTAFVSHIVYNPLLALAIYIFTYKTLWGNETIIWAKIGNVFFILTMTINMFITGGRSGYLGFFGILVLLVFQYFHGRFFKILISSLIICSCVFGFAYKTSALFKSRVDLTVVNALHYKEHKKSAVALRMVWMINGFEIFLNHPFIGVGTGDLPTEMAKVHLVNSPEVRATDNPHNMYIMEMIQFGMVGLLALLWLFYTQVRFALSSNRSLIKHLGVALPVLYFIINFGESYLSIHQTGLTFSVMSAFLYKDYKVMSNNYLE